MKGESSNNTLWKAIKYNVFGHITQFVLGNSIVTNKGYNANTGRITRINTTLGDNIFQDLIYSYDDFGNFALRRKMNSPVISETFTYDNFNRLVSSTKNGTEYRMSYDKYGRILSKEMQGMNFLDARYHSDKPHALKKYTSYTEPPFSNHSVTYTDFDKVKTVSMNGNTLQFVYGHDHHRRYMTETVDSVTRSKTYIGNCEFVQSATEGNHALTYLYGPSGIYAVAKKVGDNETLYYVHTDHLGSWNVVTDRYRRIVHQYYFDAWGDAKIVDGDGISVNKPLFDRGFTGHEHHYDFGLINMNGRMYDPYTSMFLSPDNYIQAPDNSQSFNRYAYCLNNPLKYTDPSGESFIGAAVAIGAIIGAYSGGVLANGTYNPIEWNWSSGNTYAYMIGGAVVGGVSSGIGAYIAGSNVVFSNTFGIMAASAINSAGTWLYTNGNSDFTMSFGIASYNLTQNKWGYIGKKGNSILQNIGFAMGSIANISDMYEFVSWDLLSYEQRFNKLSKWANKHHGEKNMIYDNTIDDFGNYDPKSRTIYIHDNALNQNFALAKSTYLHELNHRNEMSLDMIHNIIMYGAEDLRKQYYNEADLRAYRFELDNMSKVGTTYTQYKEILKQYNNYGGTNSYTYTLWDLLKNIVLP